MLNERRADVRQVVSRSAKFRPRRGQPSLRVAGAQISRAKYRINRPEHAEISNANQYSGYRLFLADAQEPEPDAPLAQSGITVGMRSSDAVAFARWAIGLVDGQQRYRLPQTAELSELAVRQRIPALPDGRSPCTWTEADKASPESLPVLWLPLGTSDTYKIDNAVLAEMPANSTWVVLSSR